MKIAQIAPVFAPGSSAMGRGIERIVVYLADELVARGHDVTLFGRGDLRTSARLVSPYAESHQPGGDVADSWPHLMILLDHVQQRTSDFDLLHFHIDPLHFPVFRADACKTLTTLHGSLETSDLVPFYRHFNDMPLVSVAFAQRQGMPKVRWAGNVGYGLPRDHYRLSRAHHGYLALLGYLSPENHPRLAIEVARRSGVPLKIAATIDQGNRDFFEETVRPMLDNPIVEFVGEIRETDKADFLGGALAAFCSIDQARPSGLAMIEAMACGTPLIAFRQGATEEIVEPGITGLIVDTIDDAVDAVSAAGDLDRLRVRDRFESRFSIERMTDDYLLLYGLAQEQTNLGAPVQTAVPTDPAPHRPPTLKLRRGRTNRLYRRALYGQSAK
ncbi:MAG: glycosyltransferase family 4 protein [Pseudomonadota bacterium]